jgi:hypothetical protein
MGSVVSKDGRGGVSRHGWESIVPEGLRMPLTLG